jgi:MFS family permease
MASPTVRRYFAGITRNTVLLTFASLFADISTEMLYPVLPIFLTQTLRASGSIVGLVEGVAGATQNIVQGFSGSLSDKLRKRKSIAIVGYALAAIAKPLIGLSSVWQGVLGGRFLDRLGTGIRSAPRDALIASSVDEANRGKAFGLEGVGDNAGAFLGPLLAIVLLSVLHVDIRLIFYVAVIPGLLALTMILLVAEGRSAEPEAKVSIRLGRFPRAYWKYLLVTAVFGIGNSSNAFLILQTKATGASLTTTILIYAAFNLVAALISYPAGALSDRFGRRNVLLVSFALFLATYLGFALTRSLVLIGALFVLYGLSQGIFRSAGKALASDLAPDDLRAGGVGWYGTIVGLTGLVASLVAGLLWDRVSHSAVFLFGAASAVAGSIALLALVPARPERSGRAPG